MNFDAELALAEIPAVRIGRRMAGQVEDARIREFELLFIEGASSSDSIRKTLLLDKVTTKEEALIEIYRRMRPGDPPTLESARSLFYGMFFDSKRYDFSRVGRFKFNIKLDTEVPVEQKTLSADDFFRVVSWYDNENAYSVRCVDLLEHMVAQERG